MGPVRLGKVVRAIGLDGRLGVAGSEGALARLKRVTLRRPGAKADEEREVVRAAPQGRLWALSLAGVADRSGAEALVGSEVLARREDLGEAGEGQHYWADLEGLPVYTPSGEPVGRVEDLYVTGGVDVLVVRGPGGERLVPLAPYVTVDRDGGRIVVDAPPGLWGEEKGGPQAREET
ncbi:MAG TPA: ribosome maturation factor RimM [Anaeromyxobacteraceae bacterium]|nr:ribosome maturation factor RimM [Anaeromyxobacteraceae bacterium]